MSEGNEIKAIHQLDERELFIDIFDDNDFDLLQRMVVEFDKGPTLFHRWLANLPENNHKSATHMKSSGLFDAVLPIQPPDLLGDSCVFEYQDLHAFSNYPFRVALGGRRFIYRTHYYQILLGDGV